jgi:hypothetical protein
MFSITSTVLVATPVATWQQSALNLPQRFPPVLYPWLSIEQGRGRFGMPYNLLLDLQRCPFCVRQRFHRAPERSPSQFRQF